MKKRIGFKTEKEAAQIEAEQKARGFTLIEVQNHIDGNFLVFDDGKPELTLEERVRQLESRVEALESRKVGQPIENS